MSAIDEYITGDQLLGQREHQEDQDDEEDPETGGLAGDLRRPHAGAAGRPSVRALAAGAPANGFAPALATLTEPQLAAFRRSLREPVGTGNPRRSP